MNKYQCANCGEEFKSNKPFMCGLEYIKEFKDSEFVPDILIFICEPCKNKIEAEINE